MEVSIIELLSDSASEEAVACSFSIFVSSGIVILVIGDSSGLMPVMGGGY